MRPCTTAWEPDRDNTARFKAARLISQYWQCLSGSDPRGYLSLLSSDWVTGGKDSVCWKKTGEKESWRLPDVPAALRGHQRVCVCCERQQLSQGPRGLVLTLLWCAESLDSRVGGNLRDNFSQVYTASGGLLCFLSVIQGLLKNQGESPWNSSITLGKDAKIFSQG